MYYNLSVSSGILNGEKETSVLQVNSQEITHVKLKSEQGHPEKIEEILKQLKLDHLDNLLTLLTTY